MVLPASYYDQPERRYPVIFLVPGFGGSHRDALQYADSASHARGRRGRIHPRVSDRRLPAGTPRVCRQRHQRSARRALIRELIPELERRYRTIADRNGRFLYGHSSGGWSVLWLMLNYPETFGGVEHLADPVDFRDWQGINLYAEPTQNMYTDNGGIAVRWPAPANR